MLKRNSLICCGILSLGIVTMAGAPQKLKVHAKKTASSGKAARLAGDSGKGKEVFEQCATCHNADTTDKKMGPALKGLFAKSKMETGKQPTAANIRAKIEEGGNGMPAYKETLSAEEMNNLLAYLHTL